MNARSLKYVSEENNDFSPLSYAMFINDIPSNDEIDGNHFNTRHRHIQKIRDGSF